MCAYELWKEVNDIIIQMHCTANKLVLYAIGRSEKFCREQSLNCRQRHRQNILEFGFRGGVALNLVRFFYSFDFYFSTVTNSYKGLKP